MKNYNINLILNLIRLNYLLFFSPLNRANLKESCVAAGVPNLIPTRVGGTRWLAHTLNAMDNLWKIYPAMVMHLSQVSNDKS